MGDDATARGCAIALGAMMGGCAVGAMRTAAVLQAAASIGRRRVAISLWEIAIGVKCR